jgi:uncharacterized membrane protein YfcA
METWMVVVLGAMVAGFVQGLSGSSFGLVSMSFWVWVLEPRLAATLAVFGSLFGQLLAAASVRRGFHWPQLLPFVLGGLAGIPIGVWLLPHLDMVWFKLILGVLLAVWCPCMLFARHLPHITRGGRLGDGIAGLGGGIMGGLGGFTGVVPTLWCTLRNFPKDTQRAVIQNFNLSMLLVTMATYLASGMVTREVLPWFAVVAPAVLLPALLGMRLYHRISEARFRQIVLGLLTLSGVAMLSAALPNLLRQWLT